MDQVGCTDKRCPHPRELRVALELGAKLLAHSAVAAVRADQKSRIDGHVAVESVRMDTDTVPEILSPRLGRVD